MIRVAAYSYREPSAARIKAGPWQLMLGGELVELPETIPHWDPNTDLAVSRRIDADVAGILEDCELSKATITALLTWHSPGTSLRGRSIPCVLRDGGASLSMSIPGSLLAGSVMLEASIVSIGAVPSSALAPQLDGALLWRESRELVIEGIGTRFPVELCDFTTREWLPDQAAWYLDWDPDDLEQPLLGRTRLLINSSHEAVRGAVESCSATGGQSPSTNPILAAMYHDLARVLIMGALGNDDFVKKARSYPEGTVGRVVAHLLRTLYPNADIRALAEKRRTRPFVLECELQERLHLFSEGL